VGRVANVFFSGRLAGVLEQLERGYRFTYDRTYLAGGTPLSFHLPMREEPYASKEMMPFFENLTSEGWLRNIQSREQRIDETDRFGLLLANGRDLVGAVTVTPQTDEQSQ